MPIEPNRLEKEAVLRVGEVSAVTGRRVFISVDSDKNLSELFFDGDVLRNIAVGSYIDIRKGFISLIGKVEGENAQIDDKKKRTAGRLPDQRILTVSLVGFLDRKGVFFGGTKELPLVGNEAFLLTREKVHQVHSLVATNGIALDIARSEYEGYDIAVPVDGLMNSHIAIFGNTGSGKSNTLAMIFQEFIAKMRARNQAAFEQNCRVIVFDFNNEFVGANCLTPHKHVVALSTRNDNGDKIPLGLGGFSDIEIVSILADATEKTQKPFLKRALSLQAKVLGSDNATDYARNILRSQITQILQMSDKLRADLLLDYLRQVLPSEDENGESIELQADLTWHNKSAEFQHNNVFLKGNVDQIAKTVAYQHVSNFELGDDAISNLIHFAYIQLIYDVLSNRALNEHIAPAINKLRSKQVDIRKLFSPDEQGNLFQRNVVIIALGNVNLEMRKTIPLLLAKKIYEDHKRLGDGRALNIVIDEVTGPHWVVRSEC